MAQTQICNSVVDSYVRGNNVIRYVAHPQLMERKATNSFVSYGCLTVDREYEF